LCFTPLFSEGNGQNIYEWGQTEMVINEKDKVCETCKYYDPLHGYCMKDEEWPVTMEEFDTCDDWTADDEEGALSEEVLSEKEEKSILADKEYQRMKEDDL
jgi:hypothetical protein